ncbi:MAG: DUF1194 domain-containing protein [Rhodospirillales bacterium]|nr:MAG: DUF1194 domain-containing protein [Rhodospirillales bacterium]
MTVRWKKMMIRFPVLTLLLGSAVAAAPSLAQEPVDLELVFAADGSGSIDDQELALQRAGYAAALAHPKVLAAIRGGYLQKIAVAYVEWAAPESQHTIVDWTVIENETSAREFGRRLTAAPRQAWGSNSISNAIHYSANLIETNGFEGTRKVIDVSGDGPQRNGRPLELVRQATLLKGITINALVVVSEGGGYPGPKGEPLTEHYANDVIGGPRAFMMTARSREEFAEAILRKLILEVAGTPPHEDTAEAADPMSGHAATPF